MKRQNRYRHEQVNVQLLEKALSLKDRLFSVVAFKRGARRLRRWLLIALAAVPVLVALYYAIDYAVEKAYSMNLEKVSFKSRHDLIDKASVMQMLGLQGAINMATLDARGMEAKLEANPCIESASVRAEFPETLHIEVDERIPIVFVEMESGADTGNRTRLFMDPKGVLFPVNSKFHRKFMNAPTWYLKPDDVKELKPGVRIAEERCHPVKELVVAANAYGLDEIPAIREIFRPKPWEIIITLETGTSVTMWVDGGMKEQMERLAMLLEHARATGRHITEANVIPRINPTVRYADTPGKPRGSAAGGPAASTP